MYVEAMIQNNLSTEPTHEGSLVKTGGVKRAAHFTWVQVTIQT